MGDGCSLKNRLRPQGVPLGGHLSYAVGLRFSVLHARRRRQDLERDRAPAMVWLGQLSHQQLLRIFYWGCTPPLRYNMLRSTVAHSHAVPSPPVSGTKLRDVDVRCGWRQSDKWHVRRPCFLLS